MNKIDRFKSAVSEVGGMGFFATRPTPKPITEPANRTVERPNERIDERTETRTIERPTERIKVKRTARRQSFEIYDDQMRTLLKIKREAEDNDEKTSFSEIVRTALDQYFKKLGK